MRFFGETHIDFLGKRSLGFAVSAALLAVSVGSLILAGGPRLGIDFAGGSQIVVRFAQAPDLGALRDALTTAGLPEVTLQEFEAGSNEVLIRAPGAVTEGSEIDAAVAAVTAALADIYGSEDDALDINMAGQDQVLALLLRANPLEFDLDLDLEAAQAAYREGVDAIYAAKAQQGLLTTWDGFRADTADERVLSAVRDGTRLGSYAVVDSQSVGPQVGQELRRQTVQAIIWALVGLLAYITYRFQFRFGVAAVVALVHDVLVAVGAFSLSGREFNLPVVAALLTIVGYSLNDTVVVFDRIRENNTTQRRMPVFDRFNLSLNQTLSRTLLTSMTTLIVVVSLFVLGGPVINDFSFALLIGVVIGTYSSLFVAAPIVYLWEERETARRKLRA